LKPRSHNQASAGTIKTNQTLARRRRQHQPHGRRSLTGQKITTGATTLERWVKGAKSGTANVTGEKAACQAPRN